VACTADTFPTVSHKISNIFSFRAFSASAFSASASSGLTVLVGRQEEHPACKKTEWWGAGVVICL